MALPTTREEFKQHCLGILGKPDIDINVSNGLVEARIDDALDYFREWHYGGSQRKYVAYAVTETDKTNRYITLDDSIFSVVSIFDIGDATSTNNLFNLKYQLSLHDIFDAAHFRMNEYYVAMMNIALLEEMLVGKTRLRFNQHTNRLYLDEDWTRITAGNYIVMEVYETVDPDDFPNVWKDRFLIKYCTALIKRQWGNNLKKYDGMQMVGGLTFNGQQIYDEAEREIKELEQEARDTYSLPVADMVG